MSYTPKEVVSHSEHVREEDYTPEQLDMFNSFNSYYGIPSGEGIYEQYEAERGEE